MKRVVPILVFLLTQVAVLGAAGQIPLDQLHHTLHILLPSAAFCLFALHVIRDIAEHGWPTFSWQLNPTSGVLCADRRE
jgi:hypothetical protein